MVKIFLLNGKKVKVEDAVRVEGDLRSAQGISCFDHEGVLVGRFVGGELIGYVIERDDEDEDEDEEGEEEQQEVEDKESEDAEAEGGETEDEAESTGDAETSQEPSAKAGKKRTRKQ